VTIVAWLAVAAAGAAEPYDAAPCPWIRRIGASDPACRRDGASRTVLGSAMAGTALAGTWWFLTGGDTYRSGDPAGQAIGVGLVGVVGVGAGAFADLTSSGHDAVVDRPARPTARISVGFGGASALDERAPVAVGVALDPTLRVSKVVTVQPHLGYDPGLVTVDVDPRESAPPDDQASAFPVGLSLRRSRLTLGAEVTLRLRSARTIGGPRFSLRWRPALEVRDRTRFPGEPDVQRTRHVAALPATVGFRWSVTPRQRFTAFVGPRLDWLAYSDPGSTGLSDAGGPLWGPVYAEAYYQIDAPVRGRVAGFDATSRLNLGYVHSNLDGQSFDVGAIIGFFGPVDASVDLRLRRPDAAMAWQLTAGSMLGANGGPYVEIGAVVGR